jgi:hypothetical protein
VEDKGLGEIVDKGSLKFRVAKTIKSDKDDLVEGNISNVLVSQTGCSEVVADPHF